MTSIKDPDAHLKFYNIVFYNIVTDDEPKQRVVKVNNQFGREQKLDVLRPLFLAVPTQKRLLGEHPAPKNLDHFKCYEVTGAPIDASVGLRDQFIQETEAKILNPFILCNPAKKVHGDVVTPIERPEDHLVCYQMKTNGVQVNVRTRNQFGDAGFVVTESRLFCVPSEKKEIEVDHYEQTHALVGIQLPGSTSPVNIKLRGPATVEVDLTSLADMRDTNGALVPMVWKN